MEEHIQIVSKDRLGFIRTYREFQVNKPNGDYEDVLSYMNAQLNEPYVVSVEILRMDLD